MTKICNFCKIEKDISEFYKAQNGRYRTDCKCCVSLKKKEKWKSRSSEDILKDKERQKEWTKNNPDKIKANAKKSREKEKTKKRLSDYYLNNKKNIQEYKKEHYLNNIDRYKLLFKRYRETTHYKLLQRVHKHKKRSNKDSNFTLNELEKKMTEQNNKCFYCGIELDLSIPRFTHIDHKIPLSKGGNNTIDNIVWCCSNCNLKKGIKLAT